MRKVLVALLCALLIASGMTGAEAPTRESEWTMCPIDELPEDRSEWWPEAALLESARGAALEFLDTRQAPDGSWGDDFGVTGLVTFAYITAGRAADDTVVERGIVRLLSEANDDGSFSGGTYVHYYTSLTVMALSAGGKAVDEALVADAVDMLVRDQCDGDEEGFEEWWRGGIGYGGDGRPDMSNTQYALMALAAAEAAYPSIEVPRATWENALLFLHRTQNLPAVNDLEWARDPGAPSYDDGGFSYFPGRSQAGNDRSYGSMTASGLWCLLATGNSPSSPEAAAAIDWLGRNFDVGENPVMGASGYFYYMWSLARALRSAGAPALVGPGGETVYWARELAAELLERQSDLGGWVNTESDRWWEGYPEVSTAFALLALEAMMPAKDTRVRIRVPEGGAVSITDTMGRTDAENPGWFQEGDGTVGLSDTIDGPFTVTVTGTDTVEIRTETGGTGRVWRSVELATGGGSFTMDVAPLLGPASLVVGEVTPPGPATAGSGGAAGAPIVSAIGAVALLVLVVGVAVAWRSRSREGR